MDDYCEFESCGDDELDSVATCSVDANYLFGLTEEQIEAMYQNWLDESEARVQQQGEYMPHAPVPPF